ncbi:MAG TPA: hypothetical protein VHK91_11865 [Flavisolibacter sp.]|jgi:hypothetical protein|nr:hypothetical protein [Flavisolibacter sp.]
METVTTLSRTAACEAGAYQESGHILFAYLCGYTCQEVQLIDAANDAGFSSYVLLDYGRDSELAYRILSGEDPDYFDCLSLGQKMEALDIIRRLARICCGGSVALAVQANGGNPLLALPIRMEFTDLQRLDHMEQLNRKLSVAEETEFTDTCLREALYMLSNINLWETLSDLAQRLLVNRQLDKNDIEECLEAHGLIYEEASPAFPSFEEGGA